MFDMDYFAFYNLPVSFNPDQQEVKKQFYAFSKKYHPDFYVGKDQAAQDEALERSTVNNKAYQVLSNPKKLLPYVLSLKDELPEGENYTLPQSFLMEMMDINEAIMDLQFDPDQAKQQEIEAQLSKVQAGLDENLKSQQQAFDGGEENALKSIKDLYYRSKYLARIRESLSKLGA